jgi:hypothetical protein
MPRVRWKDDGCVHSRRAQAGGAAGSCSGLQRRAAGGLRGGGALHVLICDESGGNLDVNSARSRASWQQVGKEDAMVVSGVGTSLHLLVAWTLRCTFADGSRTSPG